MFEIRYAKMPDEPPPVEHPTSASHSGETEPGGGETSEEAGNDSGRSNESEDEDSQSEGEDARFKINELKQQVRLPSCCLCGPQLGSRHNGNSSTK